MQKGLDSPIGELQQQGSVGGSDSLVLVHSSDLHIDSTSFGDSSDQDAVTVLRCVIDAANEVSADVLLLAGDTFARRSAHRSSKDSSSSWESFVADFEHLPGRVL